MVLLVLLAVLFATAVSADQCPTGFEEGSDGNCYAVFTTPATYQQAAEICQQRGGFIATVTNGFENQFLRETMSAYPSAWIGCNCPANDYSCEWEDSSTFRYRNFNQSCQRDESRNECAYLQFSGYWCYSDCTVARPFICQVNDPQDSPCYGWTRGFWTSSGCFETFNQLETKASAEQICRQNCGHLAYIQGQADDDIVSELLCKECDSTPTFTRIGLENKGDGHYTWTDGRQFDPDSNYNNFEDINPGLGNCVNMAIRNTTNLRKGQWINADCNEKTAFTCMRPQVKCTSNNLDEPRD